jgi:hypothetical protein
MDNNEPTFFNKFSQLYYPIIIAITSIILALVAVAGYFVLKDELRNLNLQNRLLSKSLTETYRPLAILKFIDLKDPKSGKVNIEFLNDGPKDKLGFIYRPSIINISKNPLVFIGHVYSLSKEREIIRNKILGSDTNSFKTIIFDGKYPQVRRRTILPNEFEPIVTKIENIDFKKLYFLNIILYYEDLEGNLYDTECRTTLEFSEPTWSKERDRLAVKFEATGLDFTSFHSYAVEDKVKLESFMGAREHSMWDYISK